MDVLEREKSLSLEVLIGFFVDIYKNALISILKLIIDRIFWASFIIFHNKECRFLKLQGLEYCPDLNLAHIELEVVQALRVLLEQVDEDRDQLQLLEGLHVVLAHAQLPQGACSIQ